MWRAQSLPLSWDVALKNTVVLLTSYFLAEFVRIYPRRLSRCYLMGTILKAAAPSLYPDGRPAKANSGSTGSSWEHFCCISISITLSQVSGLVLALGMENVLCEGGLHHHLYTNHIEMQRDRCQSTACALSHSLWMCFHCAVSARGLLPVH